MTDFFGFLKAKVNPAKKTYLRGFSTTSLVNQGVSLVKISFASCHFSLGPNWLTMRELAIEANFPLSA